uniref:Uncharacterized protein n=1 Tax=Phlebotomus papatasi TaxID=29031 RepID=A0A1B0DR76_PHLPP
MEIVLEIGEFLGFVEGLTSEEALEDMSHWPAVKRLAHTVAFSAVQALSSERDESDTVTAMAGLSMQSLHRSSRDLSREDSEEPMDQDDK